MGVRVPAVSGSGSSPAHATPPAAAPLAAAVTSPVQRTSSPATQAPNQAPSQVTNQAAAPRTALSLAGDWTLALDPGDVGREQAWQDDLSAGRHPEQAPGASLVLPVPGPLEALRATARYDGVAWLATDLRADAGTAGAVQLLEFGQVNYQVSGWIDGRPVGSHEGGYDAFTWDVSAAVRPGQDQRLVLRVVDPGERPIDGLTLATTPHAKESWYHNFGGVLGPVTLVSLHEPEPRIEQLVVRAGDDGVPVITARVGWRGPALDGGRLEVEVVLLPVAATGGDAPGAAHEGAEASATGATQDGALTGATGAAHEGAEARATGVELEGPLLPADSVARAAGLDPRAVVLARTTLELPAGAEAGALLSLSLPAPGLPRWSPGSPRLGALIVRREGTGLTHARRLGYREVSLDADGLHLNGARQPLRGVLYQPHWPGTGGVTPSPAALAEEVGAMRRLGFDFVRTHVRPAPPAFLDACDEQGLLVLAEPAIGWVDDDPGLAARLHHEIEWMAARDHHHPSIVAWCVLNELSGEAYRYGAELALALAAADPDARPVLEDSGAFFGGRYVPAGGDALLPMLDEHEYPPFPLPPDERARLASEADPTGPTAVSEYGYGTLVDVLEAAQAYRDRGPRWSAEAELFAGQAGGARRARATGEGWTLTGWVAEAAERQAQAAAAMTEALRSNPALDLLCYTQWQAVSNESSAGLRDVWGEERPAAAALSAALADVLLVVEPTRPSVREGEPATVEVIVVNDTPDTLTGTLRVGHSTWRGQVDERQLAVTCPPGVTRVSEASLAFGSGRERALVLRAQLEVEGQPLRQSRPAVVAAVKLPTAELHDGADSPRTVSLHLPVERSTLRDLAARCRLDVADVLPDDDPWSTVVLIDDPVHLGDELSLPEQVTLWNHIWRGGGAVVLVPSPKSGRFGRLVAGRRGAVRFPALPVDVAVGSAVGHFMGRVFPTFVRGRRAWRGLDAGQSVTPGAGLPVLAHTLQGLPKPVDRSSRWLQPSAPDREVLHDVHLLDEHDAVVSPAAMLVGEPPAGTRAAMLALDHLGHRVGLPIAHVPYGYGGFTFVGLPLLDPVDGEPDDRRDAWLAALVLETAAECAERVLRGGPLQGLPPPGAPVSAATLPDAEWAALATGLEQLAQAVGLEDRASVLSADTELSPPLAAAMDLQRQALTLLASGQRAKAFAALSEAHAAAWTPELAALLALERRVLDGVAARTGRGGRDDLDVAFQAMEFWGQGIGRWFDGDVDTAYAWLGRAELLLAEDG